MALFTADIEKRLGSEFWSNRYILSADTLGAAVSEAGDLVTVERGFHNTSVTFTRFRVSTLAEGDETYSIVPINAQGLRSAGGTLLPLFNTLRFDLTAATGRPSRKFYRGVLGEGDISGDALTVDFSAFAADLEGHLDPEAAVRVVGPQGETLTDVTVYSFVQMRQLRRSRRKRGNGGGIFQ